MLRAWREDFAQMMRDQAWRERDSDMYETDQGGKQTRCTEQRRKRSTSCGARRIDRQRLHATGRVVDPNHSKLEQTRKAVNAVGRCRGRSRTARRGVWAGDVRYFAMNLPRVQTVGNGWRAVRRPCAIDGGRTQSESKTRQFEPLSAKARASDQRTDLSGF